MSGPEGDAVPLHCPADSPGVPWHERYVLPVAQAWGQIVGMDERLRQDGYAEDLALILACLAGEVAGELGGEWEVSGAGVGYAITALQNVRAEVERAEDDQ